MNSTSPANATSLASDAAPPRATSENVPSNTTLSLPGYEPCIGTQCKISSNLLYTIRLSRGEITTSSPHISDVQVDANGRTVVAITANINDALIEQMKSHGVDILSTVPNFRSIRARAPLDQIEAIATYKEVIFIQPEQRATTNP